MNTRTLYPYKGDISLFEKEPKKGDQPAMRTSGMEFHFQCFTKIFCESSCDLKMICIQPMYKRKKMRYTLFEEPVYLATTPSKLIHPPSCHEKDQLGIEKPNLPLHAFWCPHLEPIWPRNFTTSHTSSSSYYLNPSPHLHHLGSHLEALHH